MKRVKITEEQYSGFLKQYEKDSDTTAQDISNMRHTVADLKQNELKLIARDAITKAFRLGRSYKAASPLDMEQRKKILRKLNELIAKIDDIK